ncbi:hypothetical protein VM57_13095 [Stenotrophomonas maltophilia]|uniref:Uncharacterized protein n=1 Tax=Stenotrophomonas maltophilia TaxID=40324 RepID=A0A0F5ZP66_STEMA|nr:hypothetical protein VM57_13095 [Stenotrophomonas maltophilia]
MWLERQQTAAADEANAAAVSAPKAKERCRVAKEWKVGDTVVQHRVCEDPPKKPAGRCSAEPMLGATGNGQQKNPAEARFFVSG